MLNEQDKQKLDGIVKQMLAEKESDETIQMVVNDFKQKYSRQATAPAQENTGNLLGTAAKVTDTLFGGGKIGDYIGTKIAQGKLGNTVQKLVVGRDLSTEEESLVGPGPTGKEIAGSTLQAALNFLPVGRAAKGITTGVRAIGLSKGASALGKVGAGLLAGEVFDISQNLQQNKEGLGILKPGAGAAIGGAIPAAGVAAKALVRFGQGQAPRIINSLIKPLSKDFSYGKNPGRAVAEEKIVANNFDELVDKIRSKRQDIGREIGSVGKQLSNDPSINLTESLSPITEAMKTAASQNNKALLSRLSNIKQSITDILEPMVDEAGNVGIKSVGTRKLNKLTFSEARDILGEIGDMTQFTGNPSDDKLVNSALKRIYGDIKGQTLTKAKELNPELAKKFSQLTEKYADLTSAEIATKYRDKIVERGNLIGISPQMTGIGSALITAVASGGAALPAVLAGVGAAAVQKLAATPGFKTRLAAILSKKTGEEVATIFNKIPAMKALFPSGGAVSPGDRLLDTNAGKKISKELFDYIKDPKIGLSVKSLKIRPDDVAALKQISAAFREQSLAKPGKGATVPIPSGFRPNVEQDILTKFGLPSSGKGLKAIADKIDDLVQKVEADYARRKK